MGFYYVPYLINNLGISLYGVLPLALIINQFISVISGSLTGALTRFFSIASEKKEYDLASKYLGTSKFVMLIIIGVALVFVLFIIYFIEDFFSIPQGYELDVRILILFTFLGFSFSLFANIYNIVLYSKNRLDLINVTKICRILLKFLFVILLFSGLSIKIYYVGLATMLTEFIVLLMSYFYYKRNKESGINSSMSLFDKASLGVVMTMSIWIVLQQLGDLGLYKIDTIIVNMFWSSVESGVISSMSEFIMYALMMVTIISTLFGPLILIAYSNDRHEEVENLTLDNSLVVGVLSAIGAGVLFGYSEFILQSWLENDEVSLSSHFLSIKSLLIPFYASAGVFAFVSRSWNKVKFPAIATVCIGVLNLVLVIIISVFFKSSLGIVGILITSLILGVIQSYMINGLYFCHLYPGNVKTVIINFIKISFVLFFSSFISFYAHLTFYDFSSLIKFSAIGLLLIALTLATVFIMLNKKQRLSIYQLLRK